MKKIIYAQKIGMTSIIDTDGKLTPATVVKSLNPKLVPLSSENVLFCFGQVKSKNVNKPNKGFFDKHKLEPTRYIRQNKLSADSPLIDKQDVDSSIFNQSELVNVQGKTKGKGFAGAIKRHGHSRGLMTHGSKNKRRPGSIGAGTDPGRVFKNTPMPGHMGDTFVTVKNLEILKIDNDLLFIKGALPGSKGVLKIYN